MRSLRLIHLIIGVSVLILFVLTGQYMHHFYDHLKGMKMGPRALFRAGHLYLMLFGVANAMLGVYFAWGESKVKRIMQCIGSGLILLATVLIIWSFFTELPPEGMERPLCRFALYGVFGGALFHLWPGRIERPLR